MCDSIELPDGTEIRSLNDDEDCLCVNSQEEILNFIVSKLPKIEIGKKVVIERDCFGWHVDIKIGKDYANSHNVRMEVE